MKHERISMKKLFNTILIYSGYIFIAFLILTMLAHALTMGLYGLMLVASVAGVTYLWSKR
tara:strand:+ start:316 stop:495 length:180 start_codon:yes stop_codon:yes gene_type:complete